MIKSFSQIVFSLALLASVYSCTKKKPDPQPAASTTTTTGSTSTSGSTTSTSAGSTTSTSNGSTTSTAEGASFNDGTSTYVATYIDATKTASTGQIVITMIKEIGGYPTAAVSIADVTGTGVYSDITSNYTNGQIKYSATDTYTTNYNSGGNTTVNVTAFTSDHITGTYSFKADNLAKTASKTVTGSFNCSYQTK